MDHNSKQYKAYCRILHEELIPAMGCTEPIALAYAAATARDVLGEIPDKVRIRVSGSMIKNVKSVIVPNTGNLKGLEAAAAAGIIGGKAEKKLEVIADITPDQTAEISSYLKTAQFEVEHIEFGHVFDIIVEEYKDGHSAKVRICNYHTNIVYVEKDGTVLQDQNMDGSGAETESVEVASGTETESGGVAGGAGVTAGEKAAGEKAAGTGVLGAGRRKVPSEKPAGTPTITDRSVLNIDDIWDFALTCDIADVQDVLEDQIKYNTAISDEGLRGNYGASIGKVLLFAYGDKDVRVRAKARAAAGSDARMNGCEMPVVINSGSGNQGITCSVPVIEYAATLGRSHEELLRALVLSNLVAIHEKTGIGTLSAYCGAVSAASGASAGVVYLCGGDLDAVKGTLTNTLNTVSGIVCDGAKASCASKIAESLDSALLGYEMYKQGKVLQHGDGLVGSTIEDSITNIGLLGKVGMAGTNDEILKIMIS